jgi:phenylpyruvate tautomerase PptA (4-oxalocrotonate tautomerase family)
MPTYTVTNSNISFSSSQLENIAQAITSTHNECTGANTYFAQVIFQETPSGKHFMGGKPVHNPQVFLHGQIRAGRTPELKEKLILGMREALIKNSGLNQDQVWIYLIDLVPEQMIESDADEILEDELGDRKELLSIAASRLIRCASLVAENAARGRFPSDKNFSEAITTPYKRKAGRPFGRKNNLHL